MVRKSVISLWYLYGIQENFADAIPKLLHDSFYSRQKVNKSRSTAVLFSVFFIDPLMSRPIDNSNSFSKDDIDKFLYTKS